MINHELSLDEYFTKTIKRLKEETHFLDHYNYKYDFENNWYDIFHSVESVIQSDDDFAQLVGDILYEELISKGILNFSFYEDTNMLKSLNSPEKFFVNISSPYKVENYDNFTREKNKYSEIVDLFALSDLNIIPNDNKNSLINMNLNSADDNKLVYVA